MGTDATSGPWPDVAIPPGELLAETLEARGLGQSDLAVRAGRPVQTINEIVKGKKEITPETALEFERVLGTPAYIWLNLERDYRFNKARLEDLKRLQGEAARVSKFPYAEMAKLGWVSATRDRLERVRELLRFLGIASLSALPKVQSAAYRKSPGREASPEALAAWLRKGELAAQGTDARPYDGRALRAALGRMREMTRWEPERFQQPLCDLCARCGVALALVPHLRGTYANGATRWLSSTTALVQLSVRSRYDDVFWFSFFHELGHILVHGKRDIFVETQNMPKTDKERQADRFAADTLIPPREFDSLRGQAPYSRAAVVAFAKRIAVAPSIVVGRLQHEGLLPRTHLNHLRTKFRFETC